MPFIEYRFWGVVEWEVKETKVQFPKPHKVVSRLMKSLRVSPLTKNP